MTLPLEHLVPLLAGIHPHRHGVLDFRGYDPVSGRLWFNSSDRIRGRTFWHMLSQHGRRVGVVHVPMTYPPFEINGVVVAPMGGKWIGVSRFERAEAEGERAGYIPITHRSFEFEPGTDSDAYHRFMITITPLKFDWTDYEVLGDLKEWNLTVQ